MTAKQILDAFSETLMQDERILSPRERELLTSLLQNSKAVSGADREVQAGVSASIARAVGETVAQRAFALLGGSIVERILAGSGIPAGTEETRPATAVQAAGPEPPTGPHMPTGPEPPSGPQPPSVRRPTGPMPPSGPEPPTGPHMPTGPEPPTGPHGLQPLTVKQMGQQTSSIGRVGVLDAPAIVRAECVVLDEFLAPQELDELVSYTLQHESEFQTSEVVSPSGVPGVTDYNHRRSRVLMDLGKHAEVILERIRGVLPRVLDQLGMEEFPVTQVEAQVTASNDGDFFGAHCDDSQAPIASRELTFVYFFHGEPRQFEGGELRLHDTRANQMHAGTGSYQTIVPQQNQIVFFPCSVLHEITPVKCPSQAFADSRFTLNGWLHK